MWVNSTKPLQNEMHTPGSPVGPIVFSQVRSDSVNLHWSPPNDVRSTPVDFYAIEQTCDGGQTWNEVGRTYTTVFTSGGLKKKQNYKFRVYDVSRPWWSRPLRSEVVQTGEEPESPVGPIVFSQVRSDSVTLHWSPPKDVRSTPVDFYAIEQTCDGGETWNKVGTTYTTVFTSGGLEKKQNYEFCVCAVSCAGRSSPLRSEGVQTDEEPGSPVGPIIFSQVRSDSVTLHWSPPKDVRSTPVDFYAIEQTCDGGETWNKVGKTYTTVFTSGGLEKKRNYKFRVYAVSCAGRSNPLRSERVQTGEKPGSPVGPIVFSQVRFDSVTLHWSPPKDVRSTPVDFYAIELTCDGGQTWNKVGTTYTTVFTSVDLEKKQNYEFRVCAVSCARWGSPLHSAEVTTSEEPGHRCRDCPNAVKRGFSRTFARFGRFVGSHPIFFIVLPIIVFGTMGCGLLALDEEKDIEKIYFPMNSRAMEDRQTVRDLFPDLNNVSYNSFSQSDADEAVTLMFVSKSGSIFSNDSVSQIQSIVNGVKALSATEENSNNVLTYNDVCAKANSQCVVDGEYALTPPFQTALGAGAVSYPYWNMAGTDMDLSRSISGVTTQSSTVLKSATVLRISFKIAQKSLAWQDEFEKYSAELSPTLTDVFYETPDSLSAELNKSTKGYIILFSLTISLCCTYASVVTVGGNPVSTRGLLAFGGILAAGLGIVGSMGLLSACGVKFVNIVGVIPFLIIGIGVDDMFLMMSSWSEHLPGYPVHQTVDHVPELLGKTVASAGIGITITSVTDFLAFVIGTTSVFRSVTNFSLYAGVAVLFCYLANVTLFSGCLAIHGRRVYSERHSFTCMKTQTRQDLTDDGRSVCFALCCGGAPPTKPLGDESVFEKFPRMLLPKIVRRKSVCLVIILLFMGYLAAAIYGAVNLPQGLVLQNLVSKSSYYHSFLEHRDRHFPTSLPIGLVIESKTDYSDQANQQLLFDLIDKVQQDSQVRSDFERCWLRSYLDSTFYNSSTPQDFVSNLQLFLVNTSDFQADVVLDDANVNIIASRCFVMSKPNSDQYSMAEMMKRVREVVDTSTLPVFAYHSAFVAYEQFLAILPATLQMLGCAVAVMTFVTFIFLPHPFMVFLVVVVIVMILTGIFGFMYYLDLTLSSVTMIHLVMSVGFSVDFSAHVCAAYLMSDSRTRQERAMDAVRHAAGPILNGALSTMIGVIVLAGSSSYIFQSFFKVMMLVIGFGLLHAVFFLPALLSLMGPQNNVGGGQILPQS